MDKLLHFLVGYFIGSTLSILIGWEVGVFAAGFAGGLKEYWDSKGHGHVEFLDFFYTIFGGTIGALIILI